MRRVLLALALMLAALTGGPTYGQSRFDATPAQLEAVSQHADPGGWESRHDFSLPTADGREAADIGSWAVVSAEGALYGRRVLRETDRKRAILCAAGELAATSGSVRGIKALVHRERPDQSNRSSFPSGHTAFAALMQGSFRGGGRRNWTVLAWPAAVGLGRVLAKRHYPSDVAAGAALGWAVSALVCPRDGI